MKSKKKQISEINELLKLHPNTVLHVKMKGWKVPFIVTGARKIETDFVDIPIMTGMRTKKEYKITYQNGKWNRWNDPVFRIAKEANNGINKATDCRHNQGAL